MDCPQLVQSSQFPSIACSLEPLSLKRDPEDLESSASGDRKSKRIRVKRQEKPPLSYIALIAMAISKRPDKKATLAEIYTYLQEHYAFFRGDYVGWRNSIRHNLSLNDCFVKLPKEAGERGRKGHKWTISPNCEFLLEEGCFRRRPRGYKARKRNGIYSTQFDYIPAALPTVDSLDFGTTEDKSSLPDPNALFSNPSTAFGIPATLNPATSMYSSCFPGWNYEQYYTTGYEMSYAYNYEGYQNAAEEWARDAYTAHGGYTQMEGMLQMPFDPSMCQMLPVPGLIGSSQAADPLLAVSDQIHNEQFPVDMNSSNEHIDIQTEEDPRAEDPML